MKVAVHFFFFSKDLEWGNIFIYVLRYFLGQVFFSQSVFRFFFFSKVKNFLNKKKIIIVFNLYPNFFSEIQGLNSILNRSEKIKFLNLGNKRK